MDWINVTKFVLPHLPNAISPADEYGLYKDNGELPLVTTDFAQLDGNVFSLKNRESATAGRRKKPDTTIL